MQPITVLSAVEQVAEHLRAELLRGGLSGTMPGVNSLVEELGVGHKTVKAALRMLEDEGLLLNQGRGLQRKIALPEGHAPLALRVAVLFYEKGDESHDLFTRFQDKLKAAGHTVLHARKNLTDIGGNMRRLASMIKETEADAWVVAGGSGEVLQCFVQRQVPVFALYGGFGRLRIAGIAPNQRPSIVAATRRLISLGHRRIVMLDEHVTLSNAVLSGGSTFLDELTAHGIDAGKYNMPGWEGGFDGFYRCLESLFASTPPTAIFIYSAAQYFATAQFLLNRRLGVPQDVSLICIDKASYFNRFQPSISHVSWNDQPIVNRIVRWTNNIRQGKEDTRQSMIDAEFIEGGTMGPVPK
ncbi:substrate-binding domain-containing protein [Rubritalea profundi]|uniref:Uncharacterized protein n=1 Tax=Rubritalea profundi TaxID=1658618 RepID=A0A2S7U3J7_9BACT|nr:substrate-binding domain-containing protein [Rubritalea profundi]PQJ28892.1 hypothetical protein BSZ32_10570 [Rubritalea profundi]